MQHLVFLIIAMTSCSASVISITHGDSVIFKGICVQKNTGRWVKNCPDTVFNVYKDPFYKSKDNVILTGKTVSLTMRRQKDNAILSCGIERNGSKQMRCIQSNNTIPPFMNPIRILSKHGGDSDELTSPFYIKFRSNQSSIDCNGIPVQCGKKAKDPTTYGFIVMKYVDSRVIT